ncbi:MAG: maltose/maltodextrin ABC transporter substrate-binding protein MalE [Gammaproteobacteria bacterium]|nr:maltose/maltodextrin ABC transporter substrate-binding protein MalE [Gammaproteobacteria bacterium]
MIFKAKNIALASLLMGMTANGYAFEDGVLTIWTGTNRDHASLTEAAAKFTNDTGIEVKLAEFEKLTDEFQQAAATGDGPDIVMWAHDRFGEWAAGGLITPVDPSNDFRAGVLESAWDAVSMGDATYGYPVLVEAVGLVYNKDLVASPPASFEEIKDLSIADGKKSILWDYNNTYFTMPMLMANGGFAFQKVDGVYDGKSTGVNNDGAKLGGKVLKALFDDGVMATGVDYGVMDGAMAAGEVAMVINGPWSWSNYKGAGINLGLAPIPSVNGKASPSFLGVQALALNAASPNADLAKELIENYLITEAGLATWNQNGALGALAHKAAGSAQQDELIAATLEIAATAVPMPSNPEMGAFWGAMGPALTSITSGEASVDDALDNAAKRILSGE